MIGSGPSTRRRPRPDRRAILASLGLHVALIALVLISALAARPQPIDFEVYRVDIVSPPPAPQPEPVEEEPVEEQPAPAAEPEPTPTEEAVLPEPEPEEEKPKPEPPREQPKPEQPKPQPKPPERQHMDATAMSGEDLRVLLEGLQARYPEYYENIIRQVYRYFRWSGAGRPTAEVFFYINRDGSVSEIRLVRSSGNVAFNLEAQGAIEAAGGRKAFGALPGDFNYDRLPVAFSFEPPR